MSEKINYKDMTDADLKNRLTEVSEELLSAKLKHSVGQFKKTSEFSKLRKEVARVKTLLRLRELKSA